MRRRWMVLATVACSLGIVIASATPALGAPDTYDPQWSNRETARPISGRPPRPWTSRDHAARDGWTAIALERSRYPDTVFGDHIDHNANWWGSYPSYYNKSWGNRFGNPQGKVQKYYDLTVAALRRGDRIEASKNLGYLSHYLIDINGPLHTQESATEDQRAARRTSSSRGLHRPGGYVADDGYQYYGGQSSPSALTVADANCLARVLLGSGEHATTTTASTRRSEDIEGRELQPRDQRARRHHPERAG